MKRICLEIISRPSTGNKHLSGIINGASKWHESALAFVQRSLQLRLIKSQCHLRAKVE